MIKNSSKLVLFFVFCCNVSAGYCQGWHIGIGLGTASYDMPDEVNDLEEVVGFLGDIPGIDASFEADDSDTAVKIFAGTPINESFGVELGYVDLGEISLDFSLIDDGSSTGDPSTTIISGADSVAGFSAGLVGSIPVSDSVSLNGRLGIYFWQLDSEAAIEDTTGAFDNLRDSSSDNGNDAYYGLGLDIGWLGLFYEVYDVDGEDVDFLGISASFELN